MKMMYCIASVKIGTGLSVFVGIKGGGFALCGNSRWYGIPIRSW